uniref:EKC/KEOPS complex subunit GON7 n=1 Tax=Caenorhabditis tropicalis TaxID=1561998 RepID=A0A1I7TGN3_9PELO
MSSQIDFTFSTPTTPSDLYRVAQRKERITVIKFQKEKKNLPPLHLLVRSHNFMLDLMDRMEEEKRSASIEDTGIEEKKEDPLMEGDAEKGTGIVEKRAEKETSDNELQQEVF